MSTLSGIFAILIYLVIAFLLGMGLKKGKTFPSGANRLFLILAGLVGVLLHGITLFVTIFTPAGVNLEFTNVASLAGWLAALLLLLSALRTPVENLAIALLPLAAVSLLLQLVIPAKPVLLANASSGLEAHILLSILAFSLLSIASLQAILLAIQDSHLRNRKPGGFIRALPPLETMERLLFQMIGLGFTFLSLALFNGVLFVDDIFAQHLVHKTVLSIIAWLVFAILLWGRWRFGWRGRAAIRWTLIGLVILLIGYFGSKLILEFVLGRT
ncbi:MAG TPA: hypothetical protein ENK38_04510 [Gammaproteobacteria bacterium]|nr:hypothetical protein [Gammaproteobacteria bacterium]